MLPVRQAYDLQHQPDQQRWLIDGLWADSGVGIIGGEPKCCKSFLALDAAVSVASGAPCLRRFAVPQRGPVLLYAAEDALHVVRRRLEGIAAVAGVDFASLDVHVITAPAVRLDAPDDRQSLQQTVTSISPRLLILDPFVRLHRIDENAAAEVAPLLAYLRELQRQHNVAVMLVHHARKGAGRIRAGQALRGSSELHAWGDSNLYLRRQHDELVLGIEHRAAASPQDLRLELHGERDDVALHIVNRGPDQDAAAMTVVPLAERVLDILADSTMPMSARELRRACKVRAETLGQALRDLEANRQITRSGAGFARARSTPGVSASRLSLQHTGNGNGKHPSDELPGETEAGSAEV